MKQAELLYTFKTTNNIIHMYRSYDFNTNSTKYYLKIHSNIVTPLVTRISYDKELECFLVTDEIDSYQSIKGNIFYYIDDFGCPISETFVNIDESIFPKFGEDTSYLENYSNIKKQIEETINDHFMESFMNKNRQMRKQVATELGIKIDK